MPFLVDVHICLLFVAVICDFIIHTVRNRCAHKSLVILKNFTRPNDKDIIFGNLFMVGFVGMLVEILDNLSLTEVEKVSLPMVLYSLI